MKKVFSSDGVAMARHISSLPEVGHIDCHAGNMSLADVSATCQ